MFILSHRGYWEKSTEKNSEIAFRRSFDSDFGLETDIRDCQGQLCISHDPPTGDTLLLESFFKFYQGFHHLPLALNIKSDGLQNMLKQQMQNYDASNVFVFDMAVPDMLGFLNAGIPVFTRQSDIEPEPVLLDRAAGVWMDCFYQDDWIQEEEIHRHLKLEKKVCLVSPELHRRNHLPFWERLKRMSLIQDDRLLLCTDYPEDARKAFHG